MQATNFSARPADGQLKTIGLAEAAGRAEKSVAEFLAFFSG